MAETRELFVLGLTGPAPRHGAALLGDAADREVGSQGREEGVRFHCRPVPSTVDNHRVIGRRGHLMTLPPSCPKRLVD